MRARLATVGLASVMVWGGVVHAQSYNPDGTPSMISPDGQFVDGQQPGSVPPAPPVAGPGSPSGEERFDIDCDPDIQDCSAVEADAEAYDDGYDPNAYQQFEQQLSPYGSWVDDPSYGRVWVPSPEVVGNDFEPYETGGQWVASDDYGFTWVSDWDWGWAPFHYGRWTCLDGYGWSWIPGTIWGPAWVSWRYGGGYVGWAPLGPRGVIVPPPSALGTRSPWRFALSTELFRRNPTLVPAQVAGQVWARTSPVHNARLIGFGGVNARIALGPPLSTLSRDLGRPIPALALRNTAPSALPRAHVTARAGVAVAQRPYMRNGAPTMVVHPSMPARATMPQRPAIAAPAPYRYGPVVPQPARPAYAPPSYSAPGYRPAQGYAPPAYRSPAQTYAPPSYRAPSYAPPSYRAPGYAPPSYRAPSYAPPVYRSPAQTYAPPSYRAPSYAPAYHAPSYAPPAYHAPAPSFHAPAAVSRPASPAPSFGGGFHRRH